MTASSVGLYLIQVSITPSPGLSVYAVPSNLVIINDNVHEGAAA